MTLAKLHDILRAVLRGQISGLSDHELEQAASSLKLWAADIERIVEYRKTRREKGYET